VVKSGKRKKSLRTNGKKDLKEIDIKRRLGSKN
jgi:hypothetical protein